MKTIRMRGALQTVALHITVILFTGLIACPSFAFCEEGPAHSAAKSRAEALFPRLMRGSKTNAANKAGIRLIVGELKRAPEGSTDYVDTFLDRLRDREKSIADGILDSRDVLFPRESRTKVSRLVAAVEATLGGHQRDGNDKEHNPAIANDSSDGVTFMICRAARICQAVWLSDIVIASRKRDAAGVLEKVDLLARLSRFLKDCGDDHVTCYTIATVCEDAAREAATLANQPWCSNDTREKLNACLSDDYLISDAFEVSVRDWFQHEFLPMLANAESASTPATEAALRANVLRILRKMDNSDPELVKRARECKLLDLDATIRRAAEYASCLLANENAMTNDGADARILEALIRDGEKGRMLERAMSDSTKPVEFKSPEDLVSAADNFVGIRVINLSLSDMGAFRQRVLRVQKHVLQHRLTVLCRLYRSKYGRDPTTWDDLKSVKLVGAPFRDPLEDGEMPLNANAPHR